MKQVCENIRRELKDYIVRNGIKSLVIGMSGGIDSALCAALANPVVRELGIPLKGRSLPTSSNKPGEILRARQASEAFCTDFKEYDLTETYKSVAYRAQFMMEPDDSLEKPLTVRIRQGNIKARLRMIYLYDLASRFDGLVLSTDNYTEYMLGFWTLHGDHADYGMIQNLWKTEVYRLAKDLMESYMMSSNPGVSGLAKVLGDSIGALPTDGLGITSSDCEQFGVSTYDEVDRILREWLSLKRGLSKNLNSDIGCNIFRVMDLVKSSDILYSKEKKSPSVSEVADIVRRMDEMKDNPVVRRHERTHFKRNWPISISREDLASNSSLGGLI